MSLAMPMPMTQPDAGLRLGGPAIIPTEHDRALAAGALEVGDALAQETGDLTLTVTASGGAASEMRVPARALHILVAALHEMASGNAVSLLPLNVELRTQEAAVLLNVSRPYLVGLLEKGEIPFRKVGNQRRVRLRDVTAYKARSDADRRSALNELAQLGQDIGVGYDA